MKIQDVYEKHLAALRENKPLDLLLVSEDERRDLLREAKRLPMDLFHSVASALRNPEELELFNIRISTIERERKRAVDNQK